MTGKRVLVVEDEGIVAMHIQAQLKSLGYEVCAWTTSGPEAVEAAIEHEPDLVLMDITLRGDMDGIRAAKLIKERLNIPIVFLTAYSDESTFARAKTTSPQAYLLKPFEQRDLAVTIELAFHKHALSAELERQHDLVCALFDAIPSPLVVVDRNGLVLRHNAAFVATFSSPEMSADGDCVGKLLSETSLLNRKSSAFSTILREVFTERRISGRRVALEQGDERPHSLVLRVTANTVDFDGQEAAILLCEDVTELSALRTLFDGGTAFGGMIGREPCMEEVFQSIRDVADVEMPVLIQGESGTGKELVARAIHSEGRRASKPFIAVHCAALPEAMLESELFGHEKGAFTGADRLRRGRFELADGGTIFLDEISELSNPMQVKLLRVLQERQFERVGGEKTLTVDVRVLSATNRDLKARIETGRFREDLYYRLCVIPIHLPPLRERPDDIVLLMEYFLVRHAEALGLNDVPNISQAVVELLRKHDWPGNVRELENVVQHALVKCHAGRIERRHLPPSLEKKRLKQARPTASLTMKAVEAAIEACNGVKSHAAKRLGISRASLYRFLDKHS